MKQVVVHLNMTRQRCTGSTRRQGLAAVGSLTEFVQRSAEVKHGATAFKKKKEKKRKSDSSVG